MGIVFCIFYILLILLRQFLAISGGITLKMESDVRDSYDRDTLIGLK